MEMVTGLAGCLRSPLGPVRSHYGFYGAVMCLLLPMLTRTFALLATAVYFHLPTKHTLAFFWCAPMYFVPCRTFPLQVVMRRRSRKHCRGGHSNPLRRVPHDLTHTVTVYSVPLVQLISFSFARQTCCYDTTFGRSVVYQQHICFIYIRAFQPASLFLARDAVHSSRTVGRPLAAFLGSLCWR